MIASELEEVTVARELIRAGLCQASWASTQVELIRAVESGD